MEITFWNLFALICLGFSSAFFALFGVIIGCYAVYKTKREDGNPLGHALQTGDVSQAEGEYPDSDPFYYRTTQAQEDEDYEPPTGGNVDQIMQNMSSKTQDFLSNLHKGQGK